MKKYILPFLLLISITGFSQDSTKKIFERIKVGFGYESLTYPGFGISTQGYKFQLDLPVYERLGIIVGYSRHEPYLDYCDEIPVNATTQYFVAGLKYTFYQKSKWTISAIAAFDFERVKYEELSIDPLRDVNFHNERVHNGEDNHDEVDFFLEGVAGLEIGYQLTNSLQLNFSSRLNTYGAFRNSLSLNYVFKPKKEKVIYYK